MNRCFLSRPVHLIRPITAAIGALLIHAPAYSKDNEQTPAAPSLAHEALFLEEELGATRDDHKLLDEIVSSARTRIEPAPAVPDDKGIMCNPVSTEEIAGAVMSLVEIDKILAEYGFRIVARNDLLSEGLKHGTLDCDNLAVIYSEIAETMNLPIRVVMTPGHTILEWKFSEERKLYWDPTTCSVVNREKFVKEANIAEEAIANGVYFRELGKEGVMAMVYHAIGTVWLDSNECEKAMKSFDWALEQDPAIAFAYHQKGVALERENRLREAGEYYDAAVYLDPHLAESFLGKAFISARMGDAAGASEEFGKVKALKPSLAEEYAHDISRLLEQ